MNRLIKFNQEALIKPYNEINTELKKNAKKDFEKDFYKLINNGFSAKTMENVRKHKDVKLVSSEASRNY